MVLSFSYSPSHSLLGPTMPRISRRSMRAMELKMKAAPDTPPPVQKKEKWPHVYQRISEDKEYHALEDYFWFYEEWNLINKRFVKKFGKRLQDVLMELQYMHRVKLENKVVLDNVMTLDDIAPMPDDWEGNLRFSVDPPAKIPWRGYGPPPNKVLPDWRLVERIGYADKVQPAFTFFEHSDAHLKKRKEDWERWEKYCASMAERLRNEEPHYPEFPYLKVFGECLRKRAPKDRSFVCKEEQQVYQPSPRIPEGEQRPVYFDSPWGYLSPRWLHFACKPGEVTSHTVKLDNVGNTVLFYRWERRPLESMGVTTPRRTLGKHITNCRNFTVMNGAGSVLPGEAREFKFRFSSDVEGFFMESWVLRIAPKLRRPFKPLYLKGVATLKELNWMLYNKLTQALNYRELMRGIGENLELIQERALKLSRPTEEFRNAQYMFSSEAFDFIKINLSMEPPVYFIPSVYTKLDVLARAVGNELKDQPPVELTEEGDREHEASEGEDLDLSEGDLMSPLPSRDQIDASKMPDSSDGSASDRTLAALLGPGSVITTMARTQTTEAPSLTSMADVWDPEEAQVPAEDVWNGSVMAISDGINMIQDDWIREQASEQFDELLNSAQIPPHQTALLHFCMYHTLHDLAGAVEEIFERVTEDSIRPAAEQLVQSFYANYLRETAEKERQDLLEAESIKESGSVQEKSDLVEFWETELKREVVVASPAENQEMLIYCFKWIQIMSELRCTVPGGLNHYQGDVEREQTAVMDRMAQQIADTHAHDDTKCWTIFSLERHKLELEKERRRLPKLSC
ncbi:hypothetical protein KC19_11G023700 [Ceratodon purpureus]|uniref:Uncharacterized protein n=1 Tax=Ceratodon purpureus TaxID=3225 RepID=A0A8T0GAC0_CERPU|nr:hypothetical protein KC19_11G023700 [Ceratodon purpureus]